MVKKIPRRECHLEDEPFSVAITNIFARESLVREIFRVLTTTPHPEGCLDSNQGLVSHSEVTLSIATCKRRLKEKVMAGT